MTSGTTHQRWPDLQGYTYEYFSNHGHVARLSSTLQVSTSSILFVFFIGALILRLKIEPVVVTEQIPWEY